MDMIKGGIDGAKKTALEKTINGIEDKYGMLLPCALRPIAVCYGGPVEMLNKCQCLIPVDQRDEFQDGYKNYAKAKADLKNM